MINYNMSPFFLYRNEKTVDELGCDVDNWIFQDEIQCSVSFISMNDISEDIRYKDCQYSALTKYKNFDLSKEYKIISEEAEYIIKSINNFTRYTQLLLQFVQVVK